MSELKHKLMLNKERSWVPCYLKSEADKVIAHHKYKRCLAMAVYAMYHHYRMLEIYGRSLDNDRAVFKINYGLRWRWRWLALADKFTVKEAK